MHCPKCKHPEKTKNGFARGKQRYRCTACGCNYTQSQPRGMGEEIKQRAFTLYKEGLGFRAIGRVLGVSNVAVLKWIRTYGTELQRWYDSKRLAETGTYIPILQIDELWHFTKKKNGSYGYGWLIASTQSALSPWKLETARQKL